MRRSDMVMAAEDAAQSWPLLAVLGIVVALVAVILVAQITDPDRRRRAEKRQSLVGDGWRSRKVVRQVPADDPPDAAGGEAADGADAPGPAADPDQAPDHEDGAAAPAPADAAFPADGADNDTGRPPAEPDGPER